MQDSAYKNQPSPNPLSRELAVQRPLGACFECVWKSVERAHGCSDRWTLPMHSWCYFRHPGCVASLLQHVCWNLSFLCFEDRFYFIFQHFLFLVLWGFFGPDQNIPDLNRWLRLGLDELVIWVFIDWLIYLPVALSDLFFTCTFREKAKYTCRIYIPSFFECQSKIQHYLCPRKFHRKRPWTISPSYPTMNAVLCTIQSYLFQYRSLCEPLKYAVRLNSLSSLMLPASHSSFLGEHESTFADHPHLNS